MKKKAWVQVQGVCKVGLHVSTVARRWGFKARRAGKKRAKMTVHFP